jgi:two-component system alkaline phosphatase synthesis response regulator PhoP
MRSLCIRLEKQGYEVVHAQNEKTVTTAIKEMVFDLLLLSVMPDKTGYEICNIFRERDKLTPVIFLSAFSDKNSKLKGLRAGADDFICQPFEPDELLLKIERLLFKSGLHKKQEIVRFGKCWIDFAQLEAQGADGKKLNMSKLEFDLAKLLIDNEGEPLKREYLYKKIWGYDEKSMPNSRTLDNFIVFLRRYFEEDTSKPKHFVSVRGVGYKFQR